MATPAPPATPPALVNWCLFLDVDGTLIELTDTPSDTRAGEGLKELLADLTARFGGAVALVSGRSIECLDTLFEPLRLPVAGLHGVERRNASGGLQGNSFQDSQLDGVRAALQALVRTHPGTLLEDKNRTVAIHFRLAPQFEPQVRECVTALATALGSHYHIQSGSMMFEIKPRSFDKGGAIRAFLQEAPFLGRTPVYIGDDLTDLDGFRAVEEVGGLSIGVGDRVQGKFQLKDPAAVRAWLQAITA